MNFQKMPGLVIAYHGCNSLVAKHVISGKEHLKDSTNPYDWLGHGQYFWENNPARAFEWAVEIGKRKKSDFSPCVIGAIIDLGICLNLTDSTSIHLLQSAYEDLILSKPESMPKNLDVTGNSDLLLRNLDCAVIEHLHNIAETLWGISFDSVRGVFIEGAPLYPNAGFHEKTHIQICVVNPMCIKGYFRPLDFQPT